MRLSDEVLAWFQCDLGWNTANGTRSRQGLWPNKRDPDAEGIFTVAESLAMARIQGLSLLGIADHAGDPACPSVLQDGDPICARLLLEYDAVRSLNRSSGNPVPALMGVDAAVMFQDGRLLLDVPDAAAEVLDYVLISRKHIDGEQDVDAIRRSILYAVNHRLASILVHPDRYIRKLEAMLEAVWDKALRIMKERGIAFEINLRYWPSETLLARALAAGVMFVISTDFKRPSQFRPARERTPEEVALDAALKRWANNALEDGDKNLITAHKEAAREAPAPYEPKMLELIAMLQRVGVPRERVLNHDAKAMVSWLLAARQRAGLNPTLNLLNPSFRRP